MPGKANIALALVLAGCTADVGHPPIARIHLTPEAIPAHDAFQTTVVLDGSASADPIDDPKAQHPLAYLWTIEGDDVQYQPGSHDDEAKPSVRFRGERPATITLTVTDVDGNDDSVTGYVQLTVK